MSIQCSTALQRTCQAEQLPSIGSACGPVTQPRQRCPQLQDTLCVYLATNAAHKGTPLLVVEMLRTPLKPHAECQLVWPDGCCPPDAAGHIQLPNTAAACFSPEQDVCWHLPACCGLWGIGSRASSCCCRTSYCLPRPLLLLLLVLRGALCRWRRCW